MVGRFLLCLLCLAISIRSTDGQSCSFPSEGGLIQISLQSLPGITFQLNGTATGLDLSVVGEEGPTLLQTSTVQGAQAALGAGIWKGIYQNIYTGYMLRIGYVSEFIIATQLSGLDCPDENTVLLTYGSQQWNGSSSDALLFVTLSPVPAPANVPGGSLFSLTTSTNLDVDYTDDVLNWKFPFVVNSFETKDGAIARELAANDKSKGMDALKPHELFEFTFPNESSFNAAREQLQFLMAADASEEEFQSWQENLFKIGEIMRVEEEVVKNEEKFAEKILLDAEADTAVAIEEDALDQSVSTSVASSPATPGTFEQFYGFGMRWGVSSYRGENFYSFSEDGSWSFLNISYRVPKPNATYIPMPLFYSTYPSQIDVGAVNDAAVWVNTTYRTNFVMGRMKPSQITPPMQQQDHWTVSTEWNSSTVIFVFPSTSVSSQVEEIPNAAIQQNSAEQQQNDPWSIYLSTRAAHKARKAKQSNNQVGAGSSTLASFLILQALRNPTGGALIPSPFVFGPWKQTGNVLANYTEVQIVQKMQEDDIPISIRIGAVHFFPTGDERGNEAELTKENQQYHDLGVKTLAYFNSMISTKYQLLFNVSYEQNYFLMNHTGDPYLFVYAGDIITRHFFVGCLDYSNPVANSFYQSSMERAVAIGFDGWMYDFGEYVQINSVNSIGLNGQQNHNRWIEEYQRSAWEFNQVASTNVHGIDRSANVKGWREQYASTPESLARVDAPTAFDSFEVLDLLGARFSKQRRDTEWIRSSLKPHYTADLAIYSRSGYTQSTLYGPLHWTGDASADWNVYSGLPGQLAATLGLGASGIPWSGSPIGGYVCILYPDLTPELMARWVEVAAFSGFMHDETEGSGCSPKRAQLWSTNDTSYSWRKYGKLRTSLFPYIYTAVHEAHETGLPLQRQSFLSYSDPIVQSSEYQYQFAFGDSFLVAPVVLPGQTQQTVYLPSDAQWYDVGSNAVYDGGMEDPALNSGRWRIGYSQILNGGQAVSVSATLHETPLFVQSGSIIPLLDPSINTLVSTAQSNGDKSNRSPSVTDLSNVLHLWVFPTSANQAAGMIWDGASFSLESGPCGGELFSKSPPSHASGALTLCFTVQDPLARTTFVQIPVSSSTPVQLVDTTSGGSNVPVANIGTWQQLVSTSPVTTTPLWSYDTQQQVLWLAVVPVPGQAQTQTTIQIG